MTTFLPVLNEVEKASIRERQPLPEAYLGLSDDEMSLRIAAARAALGDRLVILGHHYQRDEVIKFADYTGDSFKLANAIAKHPQADYIVFCGVHFMAESADILAMPHQKIILPDLAAGCSMADMAPADQLEICWSELTQMGVASRVVPITYINSAAAIKSLVGENGGTVCTSSNAAATLKWGWQQKEKILFLPDQHLGRNTAFKMGVPLDQMVVWDPNEPFGGLTREQLDAAKLILWKGHCSVHVRFTAKQIEKVRAEHPGIRVIVHPEVPFDVVQAADDSGSTEYILKQCATARPDRSGRSRRKSIWSIALLKRWRRRRPSSRSISSAASARRCSACRRTTCCGCSTRWSTVRSSMKSSCRKSRRSGLKSLWIGC